MPNKTNVGGIDVLGLVYLALVLAVVFLPILFSRRGRSSGEGESDPGGGWGKPPDPPDEPNGPPPFGIPLDDADLSRVRLRDHDNPMPLRSDPDRRPAHHPPPKRVRT
jgi:hypothetical protein